MSNSKTSNGIIIPSLDSDSRKIGPENTLLNKKKQRDTKKSEEKQVFYPPTLPLGASLSLSNQKEVPNSIIKTLSLNEENPPEPKRIMKHIPNHNADNKKEISNVQKANLLNLQINETINSLNLIKNSNSQKIESTNSNTIIKIKNQNLSVANTNDANNANYIKGIQSKINGTANIIANNVQQNNNVSINIKSDFNKNNVNEQMNVLNTYQINNSINNNNFNLNNQNNKMNFNPSQQQIPIFNQVNNKTIQMINKFAMNNLQNPNLNFNQNQNQNMGSFPINNQQQMMFNNNSNINNINNPHFQKVNFPNQVNQGNIQQNLNNPNKPTNFSSNFLHLLNKNYIELKQSSIAHVKILNPVYRNCIIPVVPEIFSKFNK